MSRQYLDSRGDYAEQLSLIEKAFQHERLQILTRNEEEIKKLFKMHVNLEDEYQDRKFTQEAYYMNELEKIKTSEADEQASTKIRLEKEMQTLQKCMEEMKAVYNLNQEKLGFNFKVLREKSQSSNLMKEKLKL
jgi:dynein regulatory complex protein 1